MQKTLLYDLGTLGIRLDNVEGMTFGPTLADGRRSLVLVADDNFSLAINGPGSAPQNTQFLVFAASAAPEPGALGLMALGMIPGAIALIRRRQD